MSACTDPSITGRKRRARGSAASHEEVEQARQELLARLAATADTTVDELTDDDIGRVSVAERRLLDYDPDDTECTPPVLEPAAPSRRLKYRQPGEKRKRSIATEHDPWPWLDGKPDEKVCGTELRLATPRELRLLGKRTVRVYRQLHKTRGVSHLYQPLGVEKLGVQLKLPYRTVKRCLAKLRSCGAIDTVWKRVKHVDAMLNAYWETWMHVRVWGTVDLRRGVLSLFVRDPRFTVWAEGQRGVGRPRSGTGPAPTPDREAPVVSTEDFGRSASWPFTLAGNLHTETYRDYKRANSDKDPKSLKSRHEWEVERRQHRQINLRPNSGPPNVQVRVQRSEAIHAKLQEKALSEHNLQSKPVIEGFPEVAPKLWPVSVDLISTSDHESFPSENTKPPGPASDAPPSGVPSVWDSFREEVAQMARPPKRTAPTSTKVEAVPGPHPLIGIGPPGAPGTSTHRKQVPIWWRLQLPSIEKVDTEQVVSDLMLPFNPKLPAVFRLDQLVDSYREAVLVVWGEKDWSFMQKRASAITSKYRSRLLRSVAYMTDHDIAPLSWALWALHRFKEEGASKPQSILFLFAEGLLQKWRGWYKGTKDDPYPIRPKLTAAHLEQLYRQREAVRRAEGLPVALIWSALPRWYIKRREIEIAAGYTDPLERWPIVPRKQGEKVRHVDKRPRISKAPAALMKGV